MGHARYIGRVGALAVALGIGVAAANGSAAAWATEGDGAASGAGDTSSTSSPPDSQPSGPTPPGATDPTAPGDGSDGPARPGGPGEGEIDVKVGADPVAETGEPGEETTGGDTTDGSDDDESESDDDESDTAEEESEAMEDVGGGEGTEPGGGELARQTSIAEAPDLNFVPQQPIAVVEEFDSIGKSETQDSPDTVTEPGPLSETVAVTTRTVDSTITPEVGLEPMASTASEPPPIDTPPTPPVETMTTQLLSLLASNPLVNGSPADAPDSPFAWAIFAALRRQTEEDAGTEQQLLSVADPVAATLSLEPTPEYTLDSSIPVGSGPTGLAVTPDGTKVYVADRFTKSVWVIDRSAGTAVPINMGAGPNGVAFSPDGTRAYVGLHGVNRVAVIDTETDTVIGSVKVGPGATEVAVAPDGSRAYVTNTSGRTVSVIDTATNTEIARVRVGSSPMGLAVSPDGSKVYVANRYSNSVSVIDTATNTVVRTVKVGSSPRSVVFTPDGSHAYVTSAGPDTVSVLDTATDTVETTVKVGRDPIGVATSPDGTLVYVANSNDTVSVVDTATNTVVTTFSVDPKAETGVHYVAVGPDGTVYVTDTRDKMLRVVTATPADPMMTMLRAEEDAGPMAMFASTAVANTGPTATPTPGAPDVTTGTVTGSVNAVDSESDPLTYTVQSQSAGAVVTVDAAGDFSYTPSQAARLQAASTSGLDTDTFTVRVSDGQTFTDVPVTVTVRPGQLATAAPVDVGRDPSAVTFNADGSRAYVTNQYDKTVSVVDTSTGAVISTIKVPYSPKAVVVSPAAGQNRAYVAMSSGVAVIDTLNNKVVDIKPSTSTVDVIKVGATPSAVAINPAGTRLYVSNGGSSTVSVIDTATNMEITRVTVGSQPSGLAVSPDGSRVYALSRYGDKVTVFRTDTNVVIGSATVGDSPRSIVLSGDGKTAYVTNYGSGTVTVLNTTGNAPAVVKTVTVGTRPEGIAMSEDGTLVYAANGRDTVSVISTATNTVVSTVTIDSPAESGAHAIAANGNTLYVTDQYDDWVRVLKVARVQTAPQPSGTPTVGTPDPTTGTVSGDLKVIDTDGDTLSYSVIDAPDQGVLTVGTDGGYSYTPSAPARAEAEADTTDTFTVRISDTLGASTDVAVTVPVLAQTAPELDVTTAAIAVNQPNGIALAGSRAYVLNPDGTVVVLSTTTEQVVGDPIAVGYAPTRIVAGPDVDARPEITDVKRVYVATYDTVSVIDTDPTSANFNTVIADIYVPNSCWECYNGVYDVVVRPDGKRVYAARGDGTISVIGTDPTEPATYHQVVTTVPVGTWDGDLEITPDGSRLYVAHISADYVQVLDGDTLATVAVVPVGPHWDLDSTRSETTDNTYNLAVSPGGDRAYVTQRVLVVERGVGGQTSGFFISDSRGQNWLVTDSYSAVSVIDTDVDSATFNQEIARIVVPDGAHDISFSPDGGHAYVTHLDGRTVTVIDTHTSAVAGTFSTDQAGGGFQHRTVAVAADGTVYVTDAADNTVYASTVGEMASAL